MATYYIGADVHSNNTELAVEQRGRIVARYSVPTSIPSISAVINSIQGKKILAMEEGQKIQRILRRSTNRVKVRRAQVALASEQGYKAPVISELVHYSEHHVRAIIKEFNQRDLKALEPNLLSGRPAEFTEDDRALIAETAKCPPDLLDCPFKRWSLEKLCEYLVTEKMVSSISIETLRTILHERKVMLRRTKTWKQCNDPRLKAKTN